MPTSPRTSLGAVLATLALLSVPVLAVTSAGPAGAIAVTPGSTASTGSSPSHPYTRAQATTILQQVRDALKPSSSAQRRTGKPLPYRDLTMTLRDLGEALPSLSGSQRTQAQGFLARPTDGGDQVCDGGSGCPDPVISLTANSTYATPDGHFLIHYTTLGSNAADPAWVEDQVAPVLEHVWATEVTAMHYRAPLSDSATISAIGGNPDGKMDVYLAELGEDGLYGYTYSDTPQNRVEAPFLVLDNDFAVSQFGAAPTRSLDVTVAHEFFHAIQFAYDAHQDTWLMEGTAVWMEDQVYPTINDYLQYLPDSQIVNPRTSVDSQADYNVYGSVTFWRYLSDRLKTQTIIQQVWNHAAVSDGNHNAIQAVTGALAAHHRSFTSEFGQYGAWLTLPAGTYTDRSPMLSWLGAHRYSVGYWAAGTLTRHSPASKNLSVRLNHLSTAPLLLRAGASLSAKSRLKITVDGPNRSHGTQARVQIRYKSGRVIIYSVPLGARGNGTKVLSFNHKKIASAVVTLTNASSGYNGQVFKVRGQVIR
ncbi:MAG TPA: MXAN_6640 family putative metalloprotease [Marmoricola sp.]|nr:MXAN_6640 family putative metalloprotease [Marmoricola sp.]